MPRQLSHAVSAGSAVCAAALLLVGGKALACNGGDGPEYFVPFGLNLGVTAPQGKSPAFAVGGEVSAAVLHGKDYSWLGGYVDTVLNPGPSPVGRVSIGPEGGIGPLGIDGGYVMQIGNGISHGVTVRALLTVGVVGVYTRVGYLFPRSTAEVSGRSGEVFGEFGLLIKYPLQIPRTVFEHA